MNPPYDSFSATDLLAFRDVYIDVILHEYFDAGTKLNHTVQLAVLQLISEGRVRVEGRKAVIS